jgi:hypothetical protein
VTRANDYPETADWHASEEGQEEHRQIATQDRDTLNQFVDPAKACELFDGVPGVKAVTLGSAGAGPGGRRIVTDPDEVLTTPPNACKVLKSSHGDVMLPVGVHLPNVKVGCHKLRGHDKIEMKYWIQL